MFQEQQKYVEEQRVELPLVGHRVARLGRHVNHVISSGGTLAVAVSIRRHAVAIRRQGRPIVYYTAALRMALCHRFVGSKSSAKAGQPASSFVPDKQQVTTTGSASTTQTIVTSMNSSDDPQRPQLEITNSADATTTTGLSRSGSTLARRVLSLFRSRSEPDVPSAKQPPPSDRRRRLTGPPRSTSASPCGGSVPASTGQRRGSGGSAAIKTLHQRRRYQRVVRDENARPPDTLDDNPFVTRKFTQEYLSNYYADKKPLPTDTSISLISPGSHPILKKRSSGEHRTLTSGSGSCTSTDDELGSSLPSTTTGTTITSLQLTPTSRHTKFREIVEIVEYQMRDRVTEKLNSRTQSVRLNDSDDEGPVVNSISGSEGARERDASSDSIDDVTRDSCDDVVPAVRNVTPPLCSPSHHRCRPPPKHRRLEGFEEEDNEDAELTKN